MDREAWRVAVHGVAKKCIRLSDWTEVNWLEELKNEHTETNNTITEIKNTLEGISSRISEAEEYSELKGKMVYNFWRAK